MLIRAANVVQQLCNNFLSFKFYRKFYCKFYCSCDQSLTDDITAVYGRSILSV